MSRKEPDRRKRSRNPERSSNTGGLRKLNKHIDFSLEGSKGNARKDDTKVKCCVCKKNFVLPFKPRKPDVYCDDCFKKQRGRF